MDIKFEGNWLGVKVALNQLPLMLRGAATWGQRKVAERLVTEVKKHINAQDLGWMPRSARTNSSDPRILVDDGDYYASIKAWKQGNAYNAGVPARAFNSKGYSIADYAIMNEEGGGNLPARPLWEPSFKKMGGRKGVQTIVTTAIYQKAIRLKSLGFDVQLGKI